jgi:hypothetical protein
MLDKKKCKGTGKAKGYGCNTLVPVSVYNQNNRVYGLGKSCGCYSKWLLNTKEGKEVLENATLKATKPSREFKKAEIEHKDRIGLTTLIKTLVNTFHAYIRERDKGKPCIACGTEWKNDFHASHFYKSELFSSLRFNEDNVFGGCVECNIRKEGNLSEYQVRLPQRIGEERFAGLNRLAELEKKTDFKWDREEIIELRKKYRKLLKELQ